MQLVPVLHVDVAIPVVGLDAPQIQDEVSEVLAGCAPIFETSDFGFKCDHAESLCWKECKPTNQFVKTFWTTKRLFANVAVDLVAQIGQNEVGAVGKLLPCNNAGFGVLDQRQEILGVEGKTSSGVEVNTHGSRV